MTILYSQNNIVYDKRSDLLRQSSETCYTGFPCSIHTYYQPFLSLGHSSWHARYPEQTFSGYAAYVEGTVGHDTVFSLHGLFWHGTSGWLFHEKIRIQKRNNSGFVTFFLGCLSYSCHNNF